MTIRRFSEGDKVRTFEGDTGVVTRVLREAPHIFYDYVVRLSSGEEWRYWDDELSISLVKDTDKIAEAMLRKTREEAGLKMGPQVELNFSPNRWAGGGVPLIAFPQDSVVDDYREAVTG